MSSDDRMRFIELMAELQIEENLACGELRKRILSVAEEAESFGYL